MISGVLPYRQTNGRALEGPLYRAAPAGAQLSIAEVLRLRRERRLAAPGESS
jgi:hypothetical protein